MLNNKPYDWDEERDFGVSCLVDEYIKNNPVEAWHHRQQEYLCPNGHICFESTKQSMKNYIKCDKCPSTNQFHKDHTVYGMYYPISSDKVNEIYFNINVMKNDGFEASGVTSAKSGENG